jgi:hypothetical protein
MRVQILGQVRGESPQEFETDADIGDSEVEGPHCPGSGKGLLRCREGGGGRAAGGAVDVAIAVNPEKVPHRLRGCRVAHERLQHRMRHCVWVAAGCGSGGTGVWGCGRGGVYGSARGRLLAPARIVARELSAAGTLVALKILDRMHAAALLTEALDAAGPQHAELLHADGRMGLV